MKPLTYEAFKPVVMEGIHLSSERKLRIKTDKYYVVDKKEQNLKLNYNEILYFEKYLHRIRVVTQKDSHEFYGSLRTLKDQLDMDIFVQCHQSYIVNMNKVDGYKGQEIILSGGKLTLPVSKASVRTVKDRLGNQLFK
jgi:DNA-binding LytR/AlgR family response regulator